MAGMSGDGLRQRKKRVTRLRLMEAALALFEERGYLGATVEDIARAAEVSRRTFFRYFPSKESVLFPEDDRRRALFRRSAAGRSGLLALRAGIAALAEDYRSSRVLEARKQVIIEANPELLGRQFTALQLWDEEVARALLGEPDAEGLDAPERDETRLLSAAITAVFAAVLRQWLRDGAPGDLLTRAEGALAALIRQARPLLQHAPDRPEEVS